MAAILNNSRFPNLPLQCYFEVEFFKNNLVNRFKMQSHQFQHNYIATKPL